MAKTYRSEAVPDRGFEYKIAGLPNDADVGGGIYFRTKFFLLVSDVYREYSQNDIGFVRRAFVRHDVNPNLPYVCGAEFVSFEIEADKGFAPLVVELLKQRFLSIGATYASYVCRNHRNGADCLFMAFKNHSI